MEVSKLRSQGRIIILIRLVFKNIYVPLAKLLKHTSYFDSQSFDRESLLENGSLHTSTVSKAQRLEQL